METQDSASDDQTEPLIDALKKISARLPGSLRYRLLSALNHINKSQKIFDQDREIASFRAITAEEEAASTIIKCIQLRKYEHANQFNAYNHTHKAAILACTMVVRNSIQPIIRECQLIFHYDVPRIDIKIPLSNFDIEGGEKIALQPIEPLDLVHAREGIPDALLFAEALEDLAKKAKFRDIKLFVANQANSRNTLIYASDRSLPFSQATRESIKVRQNRTVNLLIIAVMIWQSKAHLSLVKQSILSFLGIIGRLPDDISS
ncbi:MAG: hypothetical protein ACK4ZW_09570 [Blastomonas sp.]